MKKIASIFFAVSAVILVSGCSSSSDSTPPPTTLTGTAATGLPIDGTVFVKDAKGVEKSIATAVNGSFTLDVPGMTPPYLLKVMPSSGPVLYSFASQNGQTANLTQATNLAMFLAYGKQDLNTLYSSWDGTGVAASDVTTAEGAVRANIVNQLTAAGLDAASFNLFSSAFTADSTGFDAVLDNMVATVDPAGTYIFDADNMDSSTPGFDEGATPPAPPAPPAPAGAISIATVSGGKHQLNGTYYSACYNTSGRPADGQIDSVTITGTTWVNRQDVYTGKATCSGPVTKTGFLTATITKGADVAMSGWDTSASTGGAPQRAGGGSLISDTGTVTRFTLTNLSLTDPDGLYGTFVPPTTPVSGFYVFDDTGSGFVMYRDRDGDALISNKSDPYIRR